MPKGADNASLILEAARRLFLDRGFAATSMDAVAKQAGVSKATVYALFESKDALFADMVASEGDAQTSALFDDVDGHATGVLLRFGHDAADLLLREEVLAIQRIVATEARRSPAIGQLYYASGPEQLVLDLANYLEGAMKRGELRTAPARVAAAQFLQIIVGDLQFRSIIGVAGAATVDERAMYVESGVAVFLRAYAR